MRRQIGGGYDAPARGLAVHVEVGHDNAAAKALYRGFGLELHDAGREMLTVRLGSGDA